NCVVLFKKKKKAEKYFSPIVTLYAKHVSYFNIAGKKKTGIVFKSKKSI
ncbi:MAG: hypothetical protein ACI90V_009285, partial [Bacillariaceae sp.]